MSTAATKSDVIGVRCNAGTYGSSIAKKHDIPRATLRTTTNKYEFWRFLEFTNTVNYTWESRFIETKSLESRFL